MNKVYIGLVREDKMVAERSRWFVLADDDIYIVDQSSVQIILKSSGVKDKDYELVDIDSATARNLIEMEFGTMPVDILSVVP